MDSPWNCLYSLWMAVWSTVFVEAWKRRESEIRHMWNMEGFSTQKNQEARYAFKTETLIDHRLKDSMKVNAIDTGARVMLAGAPVTLLGMAAIVGCFIGYTSYQA